MGLFDKNSSNVTDIDETSSTNTATDSRAGDDSIFGGNVSVSSQDSDVNIVTTDYGAIEGALQANMAVSSGAFDFGQESLSQSLGFAGDALSFAGDSVDQAFDLTGDVIQQASNDAKFYYEQNAQQFDRSLAFAEQSTKSENEKLLEGGIGLLKTIGFMALAGFAGYAYLKNKG